MANRPAFRVDALRDDAAGVGDGVEAGSTFGVESVAKGIRWGRPALRGWAAPSDFPRLPFTIPEGAMPRSLAVLDPAASRIAAVALVLAASESVG